MSEAEWEAFRVEVAEALTGLADVEVYLRDDGAEGKVVLTNPPGWKCDGDHPFRATRIVVIAATPAAARPVLSSVVPAVLCPPADDGRKAVVRVLPDGTTEHIMDGPMQEHIEDIKGAILGCFGGAAS